MADSWLFLVGLFVGLALAVLCALAGFAAMGIFLGAVVAFVARAAVAPEARTEADETLRRACNRLPFCDCSPKARA